MRHADFPVPPVDPAAQGPTFTLADEKFRCLPDMPAGAFLALPDEIGYMAAGRFIRACLVPEDEAKFDDLLSSKSPVIGLEHLHPILYWLLRDAWRSEGDQEPASSP